MAGRHTISRRVTFPLSQANRRRQAALVIERGELRMLHSKDKARDYLYRNAEAIMEAFGSAHKLKKEDVSVVPESVELLADGLKLIIVVGGLYVDAWAVMVANNDLHS